MLFSVVVPCYNVEKYINKCINSILKQSFSDFELILVDDGSPDETPRILDSFARTDSRIKVIHKKNGGLTSARKAGTQVATGEFVVPIDGDDWIDANYLEKMAQRINKFHCELCISGYQLSSNDGKKQGSKAPVTGEIFYDRESIENVIFPELFQQIPMVWGKAFERNLYIRYQMMVDDKISMGEDGVISFSCIANASSICMFEDYEYHYRVNPASLTRSKSKYIPMEGALLRIKMLQQTLPINNPIIEKQLSAYVAHALFNVARSHFKSASFSFTKKELNEVLANKYIKSYLSEASNCQNPKERIAALALKNKWFILIKFISILL